MPTQKESETCRICDPSVVEDIFCELVSKIGVEPDRCRELMEKRREKKIGYPELLEGLGLDDEGFDRTLDLALDKAEKSVGPRKTGRP